MNLFKNFLSITAKKQIIIVIIAAVLFVLPEPGLFPKAYYRIVVFGDPHLPFKSSVIKDDAKRDEIIRAKLDAVSQINSWNDVDRIVAVGDITGSNGSENEYSFAVDFLKKLKAPYSVISGNHDYYYSDEKSKSGRLRRATAVERSEKLKRFERYFNLPEVYYESHALNYYLVFLSVDSIDSPFYTQMSGGEMEWLKQKLDENKSLATIIFYHAPLYGTILDQENQPADGNLIAQPRDAIDGILENNPQVFLWVSGHTHTPPTDFNFKADYNLYKGKILNIHNTDMDRTVIWTNSIYLYKEKVVIRTYNHKEKKWLVEMDRTINLPPAAVKNSH